MIGDLYTATREIAQYSPSGLYCRLAKHGECLVEVDPMGGANPNAMPSILVQNTHGSVFWCLLSDVQSARCEVTHRGDFITVYKGASEVMVYGNGSDWMIQCTRVTSHFPGWRTWFGSRELAEEAAMLRASRPYDQTTSA